MTLHELRVCRIVQHLWMFFVPPLQRGYHAGRDVLFRIILTFTHPKVSEQRMELSTKVGVFWLWDICQTKAAAPL